MTSHASTRSSREHALVLAFAVGFACASPSAHSGSGLEETAISTPTPPSLAADVTPTPARRPFLRQLGHDAAHVVTAPAHWDRRDWTRFGAVSAVILGTGVWIDERESDPEEDRKHPLDKLANAFEPFGAEYSLVLLGGFYAAGKWLDAPRELGIAEDGLMASVIASGIVTPALKWAVGRVRPSDTTDKGEFHPFGSDHSFPSGHATQAFAIASVISSSYDSRWVSAASYASAALVAYARHQHRAHWESDLVCGAAIGYAVGRSVVSQNAANRKARLSVVGSDQGPMLALSIPLR